MGVRLHQRPVFTQLQAGTNGNRTTPACRLTWKASSRVWQRMMAETWPSTASSCWSTVSTNTAVLPMPDLAWQITSIPRMAWGMHSCWTAITHIRGRGQSLAESLGTSAARIATDSAGKHRIRSGIGNPITGQAGYAPRYFAEKPRLPSEGCSKPQSWIARRSSGFKRKSLKPVAWIPT